MKLKIKKKFLEIASQEMGKEGIVLLKQEPYIFGSLFKILDTLIKSKCLTLKENTNSFILKKATSTNTGGFLTFNFRVILEPINILKTINEKFFNSKRKKNPFNIPYIKYNEYPDIEYPCYDEGEMLFRALRRYVSYVIPKALFYGSSVCVIYYIYILGRRIKIFTSLAELLEFLKNFFNKLSINFIISSIINFTVSIINFAVFIIKKIKNCLKELKETLYEVLDTLKGYILIFFLFLFLIPIYISFFLIMGAIYSLIYSLFDYIYYNYIFQYDNQIFFK